MKLAGTAWLGLVSTAAIVAMFLDFATYTSSGEADIDVGTTASIATVETSLDVPTFVIRGPGGGMKCKAFPAGNGLPGHDALTMDSSCAGLYPPLANARTWHNNEDGTIDLSDNLGRTIVEFSPGDGLAYISVEPRSVILSMSAEGVSLF
ncbi:hypothetical protein [Phyllobacterium zundukense]|uniref:Alkaline proteinase inhibitor/ Outer membrane lipoprotein Omp19 domain-containing protein n=1 Tax=Phyllobacterium zundukense TaxID=1867719 RepID=A0A2N9VQF3_9HYPH|nr:hypothetical protein [Phyllobacterium zundukense]ATU90675.1 hypothetical protein BLM14_02695 [Phyllobacterium zundukense]PIO41721.1 hypothetical protein B5P45_27635 [Phyllobacterium zundukense]